MVLTLVLLSVEVGMVLLKENGTINLTDMPGAAFAAKVTERGLEFLMMFARPANNEAAPVSLLISL